jgi:glycosyltransferase involved in cell wall biosynthesis
MRVSICTPTYNRRPFFASLIRCVQRQTYDPALIEWVIADDGSDPVEDLVANLPFVRYLRLDAAEPMPLGKKRNLIHGQCTGDILVNFDDDDYYPPTRIQHAVDTLVRAHAEQPDCWVAGCSEMHIVSPSGVLYQFGPYKSTHATAATFAYFRELVTQTRFADADYVTEEAQFLHNYTLPMAQLDPAQTILVFMHAHNSINRAIFVASGAAELRAGVRLSPRSTLAFFAGDTAEQQRVLNWYLSELPDLLANYAPGEPARKQLLYAAVQRKELVFRHAVECDELRAEIERLRRVVGDKERLVQQLVARLKRSPGSEKTSLPPPPASSSPLPPPPSSFQTTALVTPWG